MRDLRQALRSLAGAPIVSLAAILSLGLGIGANTAIFSIVNGLLLSALPVAAPDRLATISSDSAIGLGFSSGAGWSYTMWDRLRSRTEGFDGAFAWYSPRLELGQRGQTQPIDAIVTSGTFFEVLGVRAIAGRTLTPADDVPGGGPDGPVVVISHRLWQQRFGGASTVLGSPLFVEGVPFTIVGVTPASFFGVEVGRTIDAILTLGSEPLYRGPRALVNAPRNLLLSVMVRLKPRQTLQTGTTSLRSLQPEILSTLKTPKFAEEPITLAAASAGVETPGSARPKYARSLVIILVVAGLVLLVACANIANLLLARATARRHELSVRMALGASRHLVVWPLLLESLVLSALGALVGLMLAAWGSRALVALLPVDLTFSMDARVLAFTLAMTLVTAVVFGAAPALRATRLAPVDALRTQGRGPQDSAGSSGVLNGLVVAQVALSFVLVVAASLLVGTFGRLARVPLGFDRDAVLLVQVNTTRSRVDAAARIPHYQQLVDAVGAVPGVAHAAGSWSTPVSGGLQVGIETPETAQLSGPDRRVLVNAVTPGWFGVYGTKVGEGRDFDARDLATAAPVAVVNAAFAQKFFGQRAALGQVVAGRTIVAVVGNQVVQGGFRSDGVIRSVRDAAPPTMYVPLTQSADMGMPNRTTLVISVRAAAGSPAQLSNGVSTALMSADREVSFTFRPLRDEVRTALAQERTVAMLSGFFGILALFLAGLGLYGVTSYAVSRRRGEMGIRLALGASPGKVQRLMLARVAVLVGAGILTGIAASLWLSRFVTSLLYGVEPHDPVTLMAAAGTLAAVGAAAAWRPASRAARVDPAEVLRPY